MFGKWRRDGQVEPRSNETAIRALPRMSKVFLAIIITAIGTVIGALFVFAAFTLQAASFG